MRTTTTALMTVVALLVVACGGDASSTTTTATPPTSTTTAVEAITTTTTASAATTTTIANATTTTAPVTTTTAATGLPGTPIEFGPREGDVLMVVGVRHDDVLNLRAAPGADQPILDEIAPTFDDLVALGHTRELPSSFWIEVDYEDTAGWVHLGFVGYEGDTTDDTARTVSALGGAPSEGSMTELGELVAEQYASDEPESDIVQVTPVTSGDLSEVAYDVVGLGDDAVRGVRVHVFAEDSGDGFTLKAVEITSICGRGVDDGTCV